MFFYVTARVGASQNSQSRSLVTCYFATPRRRQPILRNEAVAAQLCKLCLSPLVTALSASAAVAKLEKRVLGLECVDTLAPGLRFERCIRHNTTCLTLHTTPVAFCSLAFCSIQPLMTGTICPSACPQFIYLWRGVLERWPHVACF